jgi:hypothetical protein
MGMSVLRRHKPRKVLLRQAYKPSPLLALVLCEFSAHYAGITTFQLILHIRSKCACPIIIGSMTFLTASRDTLVITATLIPASSCQHPSIVFNLGKFLSFCSNNKMTNFHIIASSIFRGRTNYSVVMCVLYV